MTGSIMILKVNNKVQFLRQCHSTINAFVDQKDQKTNDNI